MIRRTFTALLTLLFAVALTLVGAGQAYAAKPVKPAPTPTTKYVALGDSFAAGTGLTPYSDAACYRSATQAYPTLLAGTSYALTFVACSGATTGSVTSSQLPAAADSSVKVVTLTVGGNDIGFAKILTDCVIIGSSGTGCTDATKSATGAAVAALPSAMGATLDAIRAKYPNARIHVTGYPKMFGSFTGSCKVGSTLLGGLYIRQVDGVWLNRVAVDLNAAIQGTTTGRTNVVYDDVTARFAGHGRCDTSTAWVNGVIMTSWLSTTASEKSFHPTADGQKYGYKASINLAG